MNEEQFTELALKTISGEADAGERSRLDAALRQDPALQREFAALRETLFAARQAAPLAAARNPEEIEFPEYRLQELRASVRAAFPSKEPKTRRLPFFRYLLSPWGGLAFALLLVSLVLLSGPLAPKPYVAIGMYAEEATRGENPPEIGNFPGGAVHRFDSDPAFAAWLSTPFAPGEKARIWIDEEHDLIHIRHPATLFSPASEKTETLPATAAARDAELHQLTHAITDR